MEHRTVLRQVFADHDGVEVSTDGDAFFVVFPQAGSAVAAAREAQLELASSPFLVRMGLHTGTALIADGDYVGEDVHLAARITSASHGGQVVMSAVTGDLASADVIGLGEHRFRDFDEPLAIVQLGTRRFPPLRTVANTNLPRPSSIFVGREHEVATVISLLRDETRLLTLTGPGGSGKTRLAVESAAQLVSEFHAGVFWVPLGTHRDSGLVTEAIAQTLGSKTALVTDIGERQMLIVIDNLEHLVDAAPELAELVEQCPNLRLLVTSRELLRVRGEVEFPVDTLAEEDSVALFCERSGLEEDEAIHRLCNELDNLPLAVELAAARTRVLPPSTILERLSERLDLLRGGRDVDPRQQTLRATIAWSYDLLAPEERNLFERLSVFRGGCTVLSAEEIAEAEIEVLASLVEKNLVRQSRGRFWMLDTVREYAAEALAASGETGELSRRHAFHYAALAEEAYPHLTGTPGEWLDRLASEHDNLRAALDHLQTSGATQESLKLAGALWRFWFLRGHNQEGRQRLEQVLAADPRPTPARARALDGAGGLQFGRDDTIAKARLEEALALHEQLGDEWGVANSQFLLGQAAAYRGDFDEAEALSELSLEAFRSLGDDHFALLSMQILSWALDELGEKVRARALREDIEPLAVATDNERMRAIGLYYMARYAREDGSISEAISLLNQAYQIHRANSEIPEIERDLLELVTILNASGKFRAAIESLAQLTAFREDHAITGESTDATITALAATLRTRVDDGTYTQAWERGQSMNPHDAFTLASDQ